MPSPTTTGATHHAHPAIVLCSPVERVAGGSTNPRSHSASATATTASATTATPSGASARSSTSPAPSRTVRAEPTTRATT
ncbi:hypothetical protein DEJ31_08530 [Curtobacterium sp. MCPF17_031]|nr:hypothetical protein DEJ31_08530 [Curtobacterium sp. MCPF17_031]